MEIEKETPTFLANVEVMLILQKLKEDTLKKHKREGALATITYETLHYLQNTDCKTQTGEDIENFLTALMKFNLSKMEKLMMVNSPPRNELDIQLMVHESEERLSEDDVQTILEIVKEHLIKNSQ